MTKLLLRKLLVAIPILLVACTKTPAPSPLRTSAAVASPSIKKKVDDNAPARNLTADIHDLVPDGECPDPGPAGAAAMAAAGSATIPLKVGLTLSHIWKANGDDYEHECLSQVTSMDDRGFSATLSCPIGAKRERRLHCAMFAGRM